MIIVNGDPKTDKLLLSVDRREEAFKSIYNMGLLLDIQNFSISICHVAGCADKKGENVDDFQCNSTGHDCPLRDVECICPSIGSMKDCLVDSGILSEKISDLIVGAKNPVDSTLELSYEKQIGSIVVGPSGHCAVFGRSHFRPLQPENVKENGKCGAMGRELIILL